MCRFALSFFAAICFVSVAYAIECSSGPGYRFPITCPGQFDSTKSHCCENSGSFQCCDEEEFARQEESDEEPTPFSVRRKREYSTSYEYQASLEDGLGAAAIVGICLVIIIPVAIICCCCCCCACCPCYHWCHPNTTNVTVVQPSFGYPIGMNGQNNFSAMAPNQLGTPQDLPPQYNARGGYSKLSGPGEHDSNYIQ